MSRFLPFGRPSRRRLKTFGMDILILIGVAAVAAALVVGFGLYNVSARLGHFPGVRWVLHTTFDNSVETWSAVDGTAMKDAPDLTDLALIQRGAGHFQTGCYACHAAPGRERNLIARSMVPEPPHIAEAVDGWNAEQLFWIVKNGVKMSGMPQWPSRKRDDDVWAVVAFLQQVEGMDEAAYLRLAFGDVAPDPAEAASILRLQSDTGPALAVCARCHGTDGRGRGTGAFPRLDILNETYIYESLAAYAAGERHSGIMQPVAAQLTEAEMRALAAYYGAADAEGSSPVAPEDPALIAQGRALASAAPEVGEVEDARPACVACHGPWPQERPPLYPDLSGQHANYILEQLQAFKAEVRGGTRLSRLMHPVVDHMEEEQMRAIAAYYAAQAPEEGD